REGAVRARLLDSAIELFRQGAVEDVADQGGFPRTGDAGHDRQDAQRELGVHVLQVVLARAQDGEKLALRRGPRRRHGDRQASGEVLAGERLVRLSHLLWSPRGYEISAVAAGARAEVDHVVGAPDSLLVVLDHEHRVAEVAQALERPEQALVVARMQADRGLVEHVEHAAQLRADLCRQPNALAFAARERGGGAVEAQITQANAAQILQPLADLVDDATGEDLFARAEPDLADRFEFARHRTGGEVGNGEPRHGDGQALGTQALALALPARRRRHILLEPLAVVFRGRLAIPAVEQRNHSGKDRLGAGIFGIPARQNQVLNLARKLVERRLEVEVILLGGARQTSAQDCGACAWAES